MKELIISPIYNDKGIVIGQEYHGEVIRCRNCKHYMNEDENYQDEYGNFPTVCMYMPDDAEENGYCHRAERKEK